MKNSYCECHEYPTRDLLVDIMSRTDRRVEERTWSPRKALSLSLSLLHSKTPKSKPLVVWIADPVPIIQTCRLHCYGNNRNLLQESYKTYK
jgi:hypothetical protein